MNTLKELTKAVAEYIDTLEFPEEPAGLYEPMRYSLEGGGKRLRPMLTVAACNIFSDNPRSALPTAAAVEVFHNFTLQHDDIMDNADVRRGKPSVFKKWGENTALLSGDAMMIFSYHLLQQTATEYLPAVFGCFNHMALTVSEGQQLDMDFEELDSVSIEEYMTMIDKKTAALLAGATIIGAIQGGADNQNLRKLFVFATELGLAFQLQDDLLDSYGTEAQLGKRIGGDILEGKKTFLTITALGQADERTRKELTALLRNGDIEPQEKIAKVLAIYDSLGVKEKTEEEIDIHFSKAIASLSSLTVAPERMEPILELARSLMNRNR